MASSFGAAPFVLVLAADQDPATGNVVIEHEARPPKLLTGSQLLERYFSIDKLHPTSLAHKLRRYDFIASNPIPKRRRRAGDARAA